MKMNQTMLLIFIIILITLRCDTTEPPNKANLTLNVEDVSCTEAWLKLTTTNINLPTSVVLKQNDVTRATISLTTADTLLYLDSLLPKQTYIFQISSIQHQVSSNQATATALDTTSHNFTWQTFTLGEHSSSVLYDVAIINENNIWAVGEIYMKDSTGASDPNPFGLVHWNGFEWKSKRITVKNPSGGYSFLIPQGIFVLSSTEIWLTSGGAFLFDGQSITKSFWLINYTGYNGGIFNNGETAQKIYGTASNRLFTVGSNGAIGYYNGVTWIKVTSGTDLNVYDIYGKSSINSYQIFCVAAKQSVNSNKKIFQINNNTLKDLSTVGIPSSIRSIWFNPGRKYYVVGSGMFTKNDIFSNESWNSIGESVTQFYTNSIDGNDLNDIVICGAYGELLHFNGATWKSFQNELVMLSGSYRTIKIKNNLLVAVGYDSPKAIITIGRR